MEVAPCKPPENIGKSIKYFTHFALRSFLLRYKKKDNIMQQTLTHKAQIRHNSLTSSSLNCTKLQGKMPCRSLIWPRYHSPNCSYARIISPALKDRSPSTSDSKSYNATATAKWCCFNTSF